jgi:hypothetical protein
MGGAQNNRPIVLHYGHYAHCAALRQGPSLLTSGIGENGAVRLPNVVGSPL